MFLVTLTAPVRINDVKLIYHFQHLSHLVSRFWLHFDRSISLLECLRIETDWCFLTKGMLAVYELRVIVTTPIIQPIVFRIFCTLDIVFEF